MIRFASLPVPHSPSAPHSVVDRFNVNNTAQNMTQPGTTSGSGLKASSVLLAGQPSSKLCITPEEWNELFSAIQARLENCVNDLVFAKTPEMSLIARKAHTKQAVLECVQAMRVLHMQLRHAPHGAPTSHAQQAGTGV